MSLIDRSDGPHAVNFNLKKINRYQRLKITSMALGSPEGTALISVKHPGESGASWNLGRKMLHLHL